MADSGKSKLLALDLLDVPQLVQVHHAQIENLFTLLYLPVELETIRNLKKSFVVIWQLVRSILLLPLVYGDLGNACEKIFD